MSGFKKEARNFPFEASEVFAAAVVAMEFYADWKIQSVDEQKMTASATTKVRLPIDAGHLVQVSVQPAKGRHTSALTTLTVSCRPKFGLSGGMDFGGFSADAVTSVMNSVIEWGNEKAKALK